VEWIKNPIKASSPTNAVKRAKNVFKNQGHFRVYETARSCTEEENITGKRSSSRDIMWKVDHKLNATII